MFDRPFKAIYCERYACDPDRFSPTVFRRCLYRHALPVALLLGGLRTQLFAEDRRTIEQFGIAHTLEQVRSTAA